MPKETDLLWAVSKHVLDMLGNQHVVIHTLGRCGVNQAHLSR